jgi:transposase-like protein
MTPTCSTCDRPLQRNGYDRQGNQRYRCPENHSQRKTPLSVCPSCGKTLERAIIYKGKQLFKRCPCLGARERKKCDRIGCSLALVKNGVINGVQQYKCSSKCRRKL